MPSFCLFTLLLLLLRWDQGIPGDNCPIIAVNTRYIVQYKLFLNPWFLSLGFERHKSRYRLDSVKKWKPRKFLSYYVIWKYKPAPSQTKSHQFNSPNFLTAFYDKFHLNWGSQSAWSWLPDPRSDIAWHYGWWPS